LYGNLKPTCITASGCHIEPSQVIGIHYIYFAALATSDKNPIDAAAGELWIKEGCS
jgi:hypothetical protein